MALAMEVAQWSREQFDGCELGDRRRTQRVVKLAAQAAMMPDASTPKQTEGWSDCKAAYRLFAQPAVTFEALTAPHCARTRAVPERRWGVDAWPFADPQDGGVRCVVAQVVPVFVYGHGTRGGK